MGFARSRRFFSVVTAIVCVAGCVSVALAADDWDQDWTVATLARDGSWGVGIDHHIAGANATVIRDCKAMSGGGSDCGAEVTATRGGWIIGLRCDDYRILVSGEDLADAELTALNREIDLKELYVSDLPACHRVLTVAPRGAVATVSPHFLGRP